jgi:hypothetical protein
MKLTPNQGSLLLAVKNGLHVYGRDKGPQYKDRRYTFGGLAEMRPLAVTQAAHALMRKKLLTVDGNLLVEPDWRKVLPASEAKVLATIESGVQIYGVDRGWQVDGARYWFRPPNGRTQPCQYLSRVARALLNKHLVKVTKTPDGHLLEVV